MPGYLSSVVSHAYHIQLRKSFWRSLPHHQLVGSHQATCDKIVSKYFIVQHTPYFAFVTLGGACQILMLNRLRR